MEANDPQGMANVDTRDMVDKIYVGDHKTVLHYILIYRRQKFDSPPRNYE